MFLEIITKPHETSTFKLVSLDHSIGFIEKSGNSREILMCSEIYADLTLILDNKISVPGNFCGGGIGKVPSYSFFLRSDRRNTPPSDSQPATPISTNVNAFSESHTAIKTMLNVCL